MPMLGSGTGAACATCSQLRMRPSRSALALETPPGSAYGLTTIASKPAPQSTLPTAVPLLT